jgi:hypothetical protein
MTLRSHYRPFSAASALAICLMPDDIDFIFDVGVEKFGCRGSRSE